MSELYLPLALVATFFAVALGGVALEVSFGQRRKALRLLEEQVAPSADLRQRALSRSFLGRTALPAGSAVRSLARRLTPADVRRRLERKLVLAGSPEGWDAERVAATRIVLAGAAGSGGLALAGTIGLAGPLLVTFAVLLTAIGWVVPGAVLSQKVAARQDAIRKALPDTMDLLTVSVEAGLGFDAALAQVIRNVDGPLSEEISRMLHEIRLGVPRDQALRNLAERTDVDELNGFVLSLVQADVFGISVGKVLRSQAKELRTKRRQRAERKAMALPVKLLFPLIFCILPALFVVVVGPGAIRIVQNLFGVAP